MHEQQQHGPASTSGTDATASAGTILATELAGLDALTLRLGALRTQGLVDHHERLARVLAGHHGVRAIDGHGSLALLFEQPVAAVACALALQRALQGPAPDCDEPLAARIGIHVNAVDCHEGVAGPRLGGPARTVAQRLMHIARPGQILLSGIAQTHAQRSQGVLDDVRGRVRWLTHGRYRFAGEASPMLVHEVGEPGIAPLQAPAPGALAVREQPWWRNPTAVGLEAALLPAALGAVTWLARG